MNNGLKEKVVSSFKLFLIVFFVFVIYSIFYFSNILQANNKWEVSNTPKKIDRVEKVESVNIKKENIYKIEDNVVYKVPCSNEEIELMEYIVEMEAHDLSYKHKEIIACVIVNRVYSNLFPNTINDVIKARNQFPSIYNYYNKKFHPNQDTKKAVYNVLTGKVNRFNVSKDAVFFYNPSVCGVNSWFESRELVLEMDGHRFFR